MGFLNDLASIASGMKEFKDELQSMKDEVVSSFADMSSDTRAVVDDTVKAVKDGVDERNPLKKKTDE